METSAPPDSSGVSTDPARAGSGGPAARKRVTFGIIAQGRIAVGVVAMGGVSIGIVALGGVAIGVVALGGLAVGGLALGGVVLGWRAIGALAFGLAAAQGAVKLILGAACPGLPRLAGPPASRKRRAAGRTG